LDFVGDELANVLEICDNLVVNVKDGNRKGVAFHLILCTKAFHKVKEAFTDNWGTSFDVVDDVVTCFYYHKWGNNDSSYVLLKYSHVVYVYSHLVRVVKFLCHLGITELVVMMLCMNYQKTFYKALMKLLHLWKWMIDMSNML